MSDEEMADLVAMEDLLAAKDDEIARLLEVVSLLVEELDDPSRRHPAFEYDEFAHEWKKSEYGHTVWLSLALDTKARAALKGKGEGK